MKSTEGSVSPAGETEPAAPAERHAGWNELFFDLVVVAGAGQLAHLLHDGPHLADLALYGVLYLAFWTTWAGIAVYGDIAASATRVRTLLIAMFGMAVMAPSVHTVRGSHAIAFVIAYVALRWQAGRVWRRGSVVVDWPLAQFGSGAVPWLVSLFVEAPLRYWLWALGIALDIVTLLVSTRHRALRRAGLLEVHTQDGMEYLDPMASRAFAVADHQLAHVYVRRPEDLEATRAALAELPGIEQLLDDEGKKAHHLDHPRSGELVAVAEKDAWFTYYYWLDDARAPDFAQLVEIHRKPGYDPVELFMDPQDPYVRVKAVSAVARKKLGMRYRMAVVPLDPAPIRGSHGRLPESDDEGPLILCSTPHAFPDRVRATEVKSLLLQLAGLH